MSEVRVKKLSWVSDCGSGEKAKTQVRVTTIVVITNFVNQSNLNYKIKQTKNLKILC